MTSQEEFRETHPRKKEWSLRNVLMGGRRRWQVRSRRAGTRSWRGWFEKFSHFSKNLTQRDWWHRDMERKTSQSQLLKQNMRWARLWNLWSLVIVSFGNQAKRGQAYNKTEKTSDSQTWARRSRGSNCLKTRITYKRQFKGAVQVFLAGKFVIPNDAQDSYIVLDFDVRVG